jgi:choline dehydrogenase-like flavoprotein
MSQCEGTAEFDAIIVGSGPSGATIGRELSRERKKVLLLERGSDAPLKDGLRGYLSVLNGVPVSDNVAVARAFTAGGTTAVYFAVAAEPPVSVFASMGVDLAKQVEEAKQELPLSILPDELYGPEAIRLRESALALGYPWRKNPMLVDTAKCRGGYNSGAKWNARAFLEEALAAEATLRTGAEALRVLTDGHRAVGVEYRNGRGNEVRRVFGKRVILAAGAAASPLLLRRSGVANAGRDGFYFSPSVAVFGEIDGLRVRGGLVGAMGASLDGGLALGDGNFAAVLYKLLMLRNRQWTRALFRPQSVGIGVIAKDPLDGGLGDNDRYYKKLPRETLEKLNQGAKMASGILRHAGAKRIFTTSVNAAQMGGTIRINEHIDSNLETEVRNLHVCDGSVIPGVVSSPTLTLICLGKYLAGRLLDKI